MRARRERGGEGGRRERAREGGRERISQSERGSGILPGKREGRPKFAQWLVPHARHMTPTAAALGGARRRRPSPPTDGSHGRAVSKNLGRCAPAGCSATSGRSPETPGSLPSTPGPEGERQWSAASATLRSAPRPHRLRRASMARRSTAACSVCSRHSVQPRQALCDGLQGRRGPPWARWPS